MRRLFRLPLLMAVLVFAFSSCKYYKQDILFRVDDDRDKAFVRQKVTEVEQNYRVRQNDYIEFQLFTNGGELLIDPNSELSRQLGKAGTGSQGGGSGSGGANAIGSRPRFLVASNGDVLLPMVGIVKVESLTIRQVDSVLAQRYAIFYQNCFVLSRINNRRCFLFTASGGGGSGSVFSTPVQGKVIELLHEKMNLVEVLAQAGTIGVYSQMQRIRIIRGDLQKPEVHIVDLTHIYSMAEQEITVRPNDIIYVEPGRRPALDIIRDFGTIGGFVTSTAAIIIILSTRR